MPAFVDRLLSAIKRKDTPCVVGLDPRIDSMPDFLLEEVRREAQSVPEAIRTCIARFHEIVIDNIADLVPAVKLQSAFYEQYGVPGIEALQETIACAKKRGLLVILDAKRNDIDSTAAAYASAYLGETTVFGRAQRMFDVDALTVSPYLGVDSIVPFIDSCRLYEKGIFILVKTSNQGSATVQDLTVAHEGSGETLATVVARLVNNFASTMLGRCGYSSVGAVIGATFPVQASRLRELMPHCIFLVPGYGSQGGTAKDVAPCFNSDGLGALVNASRSITYELPSPTIDKRSFSDLLQARVKHMRTDIAFMLSNPLLHDKVGEI